MNVVYLNRDHHGAADFHVAPPVDDPSVPKRINAGVLHDLIGDAALGDRVALVVGLRDAEPIFPFRAQDATAVGLVSLWREMSWSNIDEDRRANVEADIQDFLEWRREHGMKDAD